MNVLEMALMIGFGIPIVLLCSVFVVMAGIMQIEEEQAALSRVK